MPWPIRAHAIRVPVAALTVVGAVALATATGGPAHAAIPPEDLAFIQASQIPLTSLSSAWKRSVTIRQAGAVPGHPGNRHTVTVDLASTGGPSLNLRIRVQADECDAAGTCRPLVDAHASPGDIPEPAVGPDGSVRVTGEIPGSAFLSSLPDQPANLPDTDIDLTVSPVGRPVPAALTTANADRVERLLSHNQNRVSAQRTIAGSAVTASGTAAGVRADEVLAGSWEDSDQGQGTATTYLPRPDGTSGIAPYVPPMRRGAVVHQSQWTFGMELGELPTGSSLVTSTGYRVPGNYYATQLYGTLLLQPGEPVAGGHDPQRRRLTQIVAAYECEAGEPVSQCTRLPQVGFAAAPSLRYRVWPDGRVRIQGKLSVTTTENGQAVDRGTLDVLLDGVPAGLGEPQRQGILNRALGTWSTSSGLAFRAMSGVILVGDERAQPRPGKSGGTYTYGRNGSL